MEAGVFDEDLEVGSRPERLDVRVSFLEVSPDPFFPVVHAEQELSARRGRGCRAVVPGTASVVRRQGREDLLAIVTLVGLQPDPGGALGGQRGETVQHRVGALDPERGQGVPIDAEVLAQHEQRPCSAIGRRGTGLDVEILVLAAPPRRQ